MEKDIEMKKVVDKCNDCIVEILDEYDIYDEDVINLSNDKFWYQAPNGFTLFKITKNPITPQYYFSHSL